MTGKTKEPNWEERLTDPANGLFRMSVGCGECRICGQCAVAQAKAMEEDEVFVKALRAERDSVVLEYRKARAEVDALKCSPNNHRCECGMIYSKWSEGGSVMSDKTKEPKCPSATDGERDMWIGMDQQYLIARIEQDREQITELRAEAAKLRQERDVAVKHAAYYMDNLSEELVADMESDRQHEIAESNARREKEKP